MQNMLWKTGVYISGSHLAWHHSLVWQYDLWSNLALNPRPPGGLFDPPPPTVFPRWWKNGGAHMPLRTFFFTYYVQVLTSGQVRSCHKVTLSDLISEIFQSDALLSFHPIDLRLTEVNEGEIKYNLYISEFWYLWPKLRSIFLLAHAKSMGKFSNSSFLVETICLFQISDFLGHNWKPNPSANFHRWPLQDPLRSWWRHQRSLAVFQQ